MLFSTKHDDEVVPAKIPLTQLADSPSYLKPFQRQPTTSNQNGRAAQFDNAVVIAAARYVNQGHGCCVLDASGGGE